MSDTVVQVRALMAAFVKSPWRDLQVRSGGWEIFLAKPDGAANPMLAVAAETTTLDAPHLGLFFATLARGAVFDAGAVIGQIELLGDREDILADTAGRIDAILAEDGALVEYGAPLLRLAA
jgi:acetyl-CoA carboxylase biotin carboxyl carrier protein